LKKPGITARIFASVTEAEIRWCFRSWHKTPIRQDRDIITFEWRWTKLTEMFVDNGR